MIRIYNEDCLRTIERLDDASIEGTIVKRIYGVKITSNLCKLEKSWNNLHNEGGEGYIPDFTDDPRCDAKIGTAEYLA